MKRTIILPALVTAFVALSPAGVALANNPHDHGNIGQPDQSAEAQTSEPRGFTTGSGSPDAIGGAEGTGFANADENYAGARTLPDAAHPNAHAVSQYDVAAFQISHNGASK